MEIKSFLVKAEKKKKNLSMLGTPHPRTKETIKIKWAT